MTSILISLMDQTESGQLSKDARPFSVGRRLVLEYVSRLPLRLPQSIATVCWILVVRVSRLNGVPGIVRGGLTRGARLTRRTKVPNGFAGTMKSAPGSSGSNFVCPHSIADIRILHGAAHVPEMNPSSAPHFPAMPSSTRSQQPEPSRPVLLVSTVRTTMPRGIRLTHIVTRRTSWFRSWKSSGTALSGLQQPFGVRRSMFTSILPNSRSAWIWPA